MTAPEKGLLLVFTGDGKGKTTAALGMACRAAGNGLRVYIMQFMKGKWKTGEAEALKSLAPRVELEGMGDGFTWETQNRAQDMATAERAWTRAAEKLACGAYDLVIFDELNYVLDYAFLDTARVLEALRARPRHCHVILTGRNAPEALVAEADLVTEMRLVKHPYEQGVAAQRGIEF